MPKIITTSAGDVMLNDTLIPGVYQSMEVTGKLRIDEKDVPGSSGKRKQPLGYEDAEIILTVKLLTDDDTDCYEKVAKLASLFQNVDNTAKPYVYRIVNRLLDSWKIKEILFSSLRTTDDNKSNTIVAQLDFIEYKPAIVNAEAKAATPAIKRTTTRTANTKTAQGFGDLRQAEREYEESNSDYSDAGLRVAKLVQSPAVDDDLA
ncbi:hypothetical protein M7775_02015 [Sporomusa sphaeroides DSM 2875]|uniref:baseplate complex protein n=1 Tax=Sporomusa sphaeroides TaxID=47679 RepID=UPI00202F8DD1|nr:hypothetical protein [Sporomusa sphaeroides]MCM0757343.1 hypothetical protein [Sporomusa sphaeroides DSM 2875]